MRRADNDGNIYQDRESYWRLFDGLDDPHDDEADDLDERKQVDSKQSHVAQVDVVRLVLDRRQYNQQTIKELHTHTNS